MIHAHARETDELDEPFALVIKGNAFLLCVRRGLLSAEEVALLDRLIVKGVAELLASDLAVTA